MTFLYGYIGLETLVSLACPSLQKHSPSVEIVCAICISAVLTQDIRPSTRTLQNAVYTIVAGRLLPLLAQVLPQS